MPWIVSCHVGLPWTVANFKLELRRCASLASLALNSCDFRAGAAALCRSALHSAALPSHTCVARTSFANLQQDVCRVVRYTPSRHRVYIYIYIESYAYIAQPLVGTQLVDLACLCVSYMTHPPADERGRHKGMWRDARGLFRYQFTVSKDAVVC